VRLFRPLHLAAVMTVALGAPGPAGAGEVKGRVRYGGTPPPPASQPVTKDRGACGESAPDESLVVSSGGLANVVVRIVAPGAPVEPRALTLDQRGCRFVPHVQAAPAGSTVALLNGDPILHNVHGWTGVATAFNVPMPNPGQRVERPLARPGPVRVGCDVHAWMSAWILVVDTPFHAVSDGEGRFAIQGVPPGRHTAIAWHERMGERIATVVVPASGPATLELSYP
jgi:plastocyanin